VRCEQKGCHVKHWIDGATQLEITEIEHDEFKKGDRVFNLVVKYNGVATWKFAHVKLTDDVKGDTETTVYSVHLTDPSVNDVVAEVLDDNLTHNELRDAISEYINGWLS
jgi:hypothetical protein